MNELTENPITFFDKKQTRCEVITAQKWQYITTGFSFNGVPINTSESGQTLIMGLVLAAMQDPNFTCNFKLADGSFTELNATAIIALSSALSNFVQAAFNKESELLAQIDAAETEEKLYAITW